MDENELKQRTKQFALRVIKLVNALPKSPAGYAIGRQLIRSGTSMGANYRAACRGKREPTLSQSSPSSKKKRLNQVSGWNW
jgi:four helix bundle protein